MFIPPLICTVIRHQISKGRSKTKRKFYSIQLRSGWRVKYDEENTNKLIKKANNGEKRES